MQCEMCGKSVPRTRRFLVERTVLNVGPECERFGKPLEPGPGSIKDVRPGNVPLAMEQRQKRMGTRDVYSAPELQQELVDDFGPRIQMAREKKGWTRQDLGGRVGEREPTVARIEAGSLRPPDEVARRIEKELGISLYHQIDAVTTKHQKATGFTLGDMLKDALEKDKAKPKKK